ncbi:MAG: apolipoprotein N-acyltransferase [Gammaproteobacteria bacterium]
MPPNTTIYSHDERNALLRADHEIPPLIGDVLALLAGATLPLAFAPYGWWPLSIVALAVLFRCWVDITAKRAWWRGWLFGLGMFGIGIAWVQISVHQFGLPILAFSVSVTALLVMFMALYPALAGYLIARWNIESNTMRFLVVMPAVWTLCEWLRAWLFTGFPWLSVGYAHVDSPLSAFAPIGGVFAVSLVAAMVAGAVVLLLYNYRVALVAFVSVWVIARLASLSNWTHIEGQPLKVALVQGGIEQSQKWDPGLKDRTLALYEKLTEGYWGGAKIIVWPETAIPAFGSEVKEFLTSLADRAQRSGTDILLGVPVDERDNNGHIQDYYNSIVTLGSNIARYDKRHLVILGEYPPFKDILMPILRSLSIPMSEFSTGTTTQEPLQAAGLKLAPSICFEDAFGNELIDFLPDARLLVNVSNDAWFGDSMAPHQHLQIARMRALETGRYLLRATNNGISAIIDEHGRVIAKSPQFIAHVLTAEVQPRNGATPYVAIGNALIVSICSVMLAFAWIWVRLRS